MLKLLKRTPTVPASDARIDLQIRNLLDDPSLQRAMAVADESVDAEAMPRASRRRLLRIAA